MGIFLLVVTVLSGTLYAYGKRNGRREGMLEWRGRPVPISYAAPDVWFTCLAVIGKNEYVLMQNEHGGYFLFDTNEPEFSPIVGCKYRKTFVDLDEYRWTRVALAS